MISLLECDQDMSMGRGASLHDNSSSACITVCGGRNMKACTHAYVECLQQHSTDNSWHDQMQRQDLLAMRYNGRSSHQVAWHHHPIKFVGWWWHIKASSFRGKKHQTRVQGCLPSFIPPAAAKGQQPPKLRPVRV